MKRTTLVLALVIALLLSTAGIKFVRIGVADPYIPPEMAPLGYRINSDGTYDVPNLRRDGYTYTFTGDVNGTIVIERDGILLNGVDHILQGNGGSSGIWLQDRNNVTIKNLTIQNFYYGIRFSHYEADARVGNNNPIYPTACTIEACKITNNNYGISFSGLNCSLLANFVANNTHGVAFSGSGNIFKNNQLNSNQYCFLDYGYGNNDVDTSNIVNGKPIYYWINQQNMAVPENAAIVVLHDCKNILIKNLNLNGSYAGITLYNTNDSRIYGNTISQNDYGIYLYKSYNNEIIDNQLLQNNNDGIQQYISENATISNNLITSNGGGIDDTDSKNSIISNNQIMNNSGRGIQASASGVVDGNYVYGNGNDGIYFYDISGSKVTNNTIRANGGNGIGFGIGTNGTIMNNLISKNKIGIWIYRASNNNILSNNISENYYWGIQFDGWREEAPQNNLIYGNNFIDNNNKSIQVSISIHTFYNAWDNGAVGNYWSDYHGQGTYVIDENNVDHHPLMQPVDISLVASSPLTIIVGAVVVILVFACVGLLLYFKKRKNKGE